MVLGIVLFLLLGCAGDALAGTTVLAPDAVLLDDAGVAALERDAGIRDWLHARSRELAAGDDAAVALALARGPARSASRGTSARRRASSTGSRAALRVPD